MNWSQLSSLSLEEIIAWAAPQPWCRSMASCQQDAKWHAEGDVWTHTKMVCRQLPLLPNWDKLTQEERTILIFTALFHDSAKPLTTQVDPETGRVSSPKHSLKGEQLCRSVLREWGCDLTLREKIARMVRFHGRPAFLLEKADPNHEVISLSWLLSNKLLYLFALADNRGRTTDSGRSEENIELWKLASEENICFDQQFAFTNDHHRFLFYREPVNLFYEPHEDYRCDVTMMAGLPGSGKDTWLLQNKPTLPVVSLDDIRGEMGVDPTDNQGVVIQAAQEKCREHLRDKRDFAFNATNLMRSTRKRWIDLFAGYNAYIEIAYVEPPLSVILQQNKQRKRNVPEQVIRDLADKIEPPTWTEAHRLFLK